MWAGFVSQPLTKKLFPTPKASDTEAESERVLKDHETLAGYYPIAALTVACGALLVPEIGSGGGSHALFSIPHPTTFLVAAIISGALNVGLFYFFIKALRYGDLSIIASSQALNPVLALPVSFAAFALFPHIVSNPSISFAGFVGIMVVVAGIAINGFLQRAAKKQVSAPAGDWFAAHPFASALTSACFAALSINFDKIAVDAGNAFAAGVVTLGTVALITLVWILVQSGYARVHFIIKNHAKAFLIVGIVYGILIITFNLVLAENNVNYYGAIKRAVVVWSTLYGIYILSEGASSRDKLARLLVSLSILAGSFLIMWKG
jgi:uncharacterized membrane protein